MNGSHVPTWLVLTNEWETRSPSGVTMFLCLCSTSQWTWVDMEPPCWVPHHSCHGQLLRPKQSLRKEKLTVCCCKPLKWVWFLLQLNLAYPLSYKYQPHRAVVRVQWLVHVSPWQGGTGVISIYIGEKKYCVLPLHKYLQGRKVTCLHIHFLLWVSVGNWALFYRRRIREVLKAHRMMGCIIPRVCFPSPRPWKWPYLRVQMDTWKSLQVHVNLMSLSADDTIFPLLKILMLQHEPKC